jgi:hypothetical protein
MTYLSCVALSRHSVTKKRQLLCVVFAKKGELPHVLGGVFSAIHTETRQKL